MLITYSPADGFIYRLNPLLKGLFVIVAIVLFSVVAENLTELILLFSGMLFIALLGKVRLIPIVVSLNKIWLLLLIVGLIQGFSRGEFLPTLALVAIVRIIGVFFAAGIFVTISSQSELMYFWEQVFRPLQLLGIQPRELALVMVISVRFMPVILAEIDRIRMAQMARGAKFSSGIGLTAVKSLLPLLVPTLSLAIVRAGELAMAMEARGYCVSRQRSRYRQFRLGFNDFFVAAILLAVIIGFFMKHV